MAIGTAQTSGQISAGTKALQSALQSARTGVWWSAFFSIFINLLMLTGPLYMLQVYDRVLSSRSVPTLVALTVLIAGLFLAMGLLEMVRGRLMNRMAGRMHTLLGRPVFDAVMMSPASRKGPPDQPLRDLSTLRQFLAGPGPFTFFDAPWTPVFLAVIFFMHPILGWIALIGGIIMLILGIINEGASSKRMQEATAASSLGQRAVQQNVRNSEVIAALGMHGVMADRWQKFHQTADQASRKASDVMGGLSSFTKTLRMFLQSAILGAGAWLAIQDIITPGMMIAASIITGRALAPIDQAVSRWGSVVATRSAYRRLKEMLANHAGEPDGLTLQKPEGRLTLEKVFAAPPGIARPYLKNISFEVQPGEALGIIGPSAAGKSTLARLIIGIWEPLGGTVRLDGAEVSSWSRMDLGPHLGYLPQDVELFEGSVAENISRFRENAEPKDIIEAASDVAAHDLILSLPDGYNTQIGDAGCHLSAGQRQRIALARAVFGAPSLVVLDEPNANLDAAGDAALAQAIVRLKERGVTVIVIAHRPSAIASVDKLAMIKDGTLAAFGPKDEVLEKVLKARKPKPESMRAKSPGGPFGEKHEKITKAPPPKLLETTEDEP